MKRISLKMTIPLAAAALVCGAGPAAALPLEVDDMSGISSTASCQAYSSNPAGSACFHASGDYFYLRDVSGPGKVAVYWKLTDGSRTGIIRWGATAQFVNGVKNKNLPEEKRVSIRFGVCENSRCDRTSDINFQGSSWSTANV